MNKWTKKERNNAEQALRVLASQPEWDFVIARSGLSQAESALANLAYRAANLPPYFPLLQYCEEWRRIYAEAAQLLEEGWEP